MENRFSEAPRITIDANSCRKCGLCAQICPIKVFNHQEGKIPSIQNNEECVLCGHCISFCPANSIIHSGFDKSNFIKIEEKHPVTPEAAFKFLSQRRSLRHYRDEVPSREMLEKIINIAGYAPNSPHHRIGWVRNAVVVTGHEYMKTVTEMTVEYMQELLKLLNGWFMKFAAKYDERAKAALAIVPSFEIALNEYRLGNNCITYDAPAAIFLHAPIKSSTPHIDCDTAAMVIQLYAEANGLGTCWNGLIQGAAAGDYVRKFSKMKELLKIPQDHKCYAAMTIGYPSVSFHSVPERKTDISWLASSNN